MGWGMRKTAAAIALACVVLAVAGCEHEPQSESADQAVAAGDTQSSEPKDSKEVLTCIKVVSARLMAGWRETVGAEQNPGGRELARTFDRTYRPGDPEYDAFNQRFQEGIPVLTQEIAVKKRDKEEVLTEQLAEVTKYVRQDCVVAYQQ